MHTPITGAAVFGGVGMGPQEHAFRSGVDVIVATPGRLLDHFRAPYAKLDRASSTSCSTKPIACSTWASCRTSAAILRHLPTKRQTLFFSATMPPPIAALAREMLHNPVTINLERQSAPAVGITQAVYPVSQELKPRSSSRCSSAARCSEALVFTRTKHRANRLAELPGAAAASRPSASTATARRRSAREALAGFKDGKYRVLVATDIAARGIDVEALGHVVNFDVPVVPDDYIHRVGRTGARRGDRRRVHVRRRRTRKATCGRSSGRSASACRASRVPDFDYNAKPPGALRGPARRAHRRDPGAEGRGARPRARQRRTALPRRTPIAAAAARVMPQRQADRLDETVAPAAALNAAARRAHDDRGQEGATLL